MNLSAEIKQTSWIKIIVYSLIVLGLYYASFKHLSQRWQGEDFSYCYLIPPIVLYLFWDKRENLLGILSRPSWTGFVFIAFGMFLYWLGELGGEYFTLYISFWFVVVGLFWIHFGWKKLITIWFPLVMILASFTPPDFLYNRLTLKLKLISSQLGVVLLHAYGMSAYREGNIIDLGFTQLQVVDACSGLRYLFPLLILGVLLAYFSRAALWKKLIIIISTIPLTIFTNSLRIAMTGIVFEIWGPKAAEGFFHGFSGWFIFMTALAALLFEMWVLKHVGARRPRTASIEDRGKPGIKKDAASQSETKDIDSDLPHDISNSQPDFAEDKMPITSKLRSEMKAEPSRGAGKSSTMKGIFSFFKPPQFVVAVALLVTTLVLAQAVEFREKIPISKSLDQFPLRIGEWTGKRTSMEQRIIDKLDLSDYIMVDYKDESDRWVNFYVAYYESQRKGESIHSPASCLPGSGWIFNQAGRATFPISEIDRGFIPVNRAFMEKSGYRQLSYYWFPQRGRTLTNAYQLKFFAFWDALTRQRTDGALVRVITPVYKDENLESAEKRLQSFAREIVPVLREFLPN